MHERLSRYRRFRGDSPEGLMSFLAQKRIEADFSSRSVDAAPFRAIVNAAYLDGMYLSYMHYSRPLRLLGSPPRPDYGLSLPVDGSFRTRLDGREFDCGGGLTTIASPSSAQLLDLAGTCGRIGVSFARDAVIAHLSSLLGEGVEREPEFEPAIDLAGGPGARLKRVLLYVLDELEAEELGDEPGVWRRELEQLALTALLLQVPHNASNRLREPGGAAMPADVKRAVDYLQANLDRPLTLAELATAARVPGRTLLRHFRDFTGKSPLAYARGERLRRARDDLRRPDGGGVTEVATRWGFAHFGRFAVEYRRRFGERPSDTRRRSR